MRYLILVLVTLVFTCCTTPGGRRVLVVAAPHDDRVFDPELTREAAVGLADHLEREGLGHEESRPIDEVLVLMPRDRLDPDPVTAHASAMDAELIFHAWIHELERPGRAGSSTGGVAIVNLDGKVIGQATSGVRDAKLEPRDHTPAEWRQAREFAIGRLRAIYKMVEVLGEFNETLGR